MVYPGMEKEYTLWYTGYERCTPVYYPGMREVYPGVLPGYVPLCVYPVYTPVHPWVYHCTSVLAATCTLGA